MSNPDDTHSDMQLLAAKIDSLAADMRVVKRYLIGESEPENSLMFKVSRHDEKFETIEKSREKATGIAWTALGTAAGALALWVVNKFTGGSATP